MTVFPETVSPETIAAIRFGYGRPHRGPVDAAGMLARLEAPDAVAARLPHLPFEDAVRATRAFREASRAMRQGDEDAKPVREMWRRWLHTAATEGFATSLARMLETEDPFRERLVWFWADHFTVRMTRLFLRPSCENFIDDAIRPHVTGRFADLLKAAVTHPVMLLYLDQVASVGPTSRVGRKGERGLNENLAREVLELHTLGVGAGYTQADVTQFAELLTGLHFSLTRGFRYRRGWAEPGAETVLGERYGGDRARLADIHAALDDLARHPATAAHLARKLAVHFVADDPDPDLVAHMTGAYRRSDGALPAVYAALLEHPAAWRGFGAKVKPPLEYVASALKALGAGAADLRLLKTGQVRRFLLVPLARMGQPYQAPPGPDGWPEAAGAWISPSGLAARIAFAGEILRRMDRQPEDPVAFLDHALGDAAGDWLRWAVGAAETRGEAAGLVLASPEFNRR